MHFSFILAVVLFVAAVVLANVAIPALAGAEMLCFLVAVFSGFIGLVNSGCGADGVTLK